MPKKEIVMTGGAAATETQTRARPFSLLWLRPCGRVGWCDSAGGEEIESAALAADWSTLMSGEMLNAQTSRGALARAVPVRMMVEAETASRF